MCPEPGIRGWAAYSGNTCLLMRQINQIQFRDLFLDYGQLYYSHIEARSSKGIVCGDGNVSLAGTALTFVL